MNVEADVVLALVKPRCPVTTQKWLAVGCRRCPVTTQKWLAVGCRRQKRVEIGICVAFCRRDSSLLQPRPGQVCGGTLSCVEGGASFGISGPLEEAGTSLGLPSSARCLLSQSWVVQAVPFPAWLSASHWEEQPGAAVKTWPV